MKKLLSFVLAASVFAAEAADASAGEVDVLGSAFTRTPAYAEAMARRDVPSRAAQVFSVNHFIANIDVFSHMLQRDLQRNDRTIVDVTDLFVDFADQEKRNSQAESRPYCVWKVQNNLYDRLKDQQASYELAIDMINVLNLHKNPHTTLTLQEFSHILERVRDELRTRYKEPGQQLEWENARYCYRNFLHLVFGIEFDVGGFEDAFLNVPANAPLEQ